MYNNKITNSLIQTENGTIDFSDSEDISEWAFKSTCFMNGLNIMKGTGDNRFEPKGLYTVEQSIVSSLRIYDLGVSLKLGEIVSIVDDSVPFARFPVSDETPSELQQYANETIVLINAERAKIGISPLLATEILTSAANTCVTELEKVYSHDRPDGRSFSTIFSDLGITYSLKGENLAKGYESSVDWVAGWMDSETHRENILNEAYNRLGVGVHRDNEGMLYAALLLTN